MCSMGDCARLKKVKHMQIRNTGGDHIVRAMSIAEGIALGIASVIVGLSIAIAVLVFTLTNFVQF